MKNIVILLAIILNSISCGDKETIIVQGTIGNKFFFSSTQRFTKEDRSELILKMDNYINLSNKLETYYRLLNQGHREKAKSIIESDEELKNTNEFGLGTIYTLTKMYEHDILFQPMIKCNEFPDSHLISISEEQLSELDPFLYSKTLELTLIRIGEIEMDNIMLYKLLKFKLIEE